MVLFLAVIAAVILADQVTKIVVVTHMELYESVDLIPKVFRFTYIHNEGAAFGMLANQRWVFMVFSTVALLALLYYLFRSRKESKWFTIPLSVIIGGGIANMIDRVRLGYVIDFLDFYLIPAWKWIFNVADACVVVGAMILIVHLLIRLVREIRKKRQNEAGDGETVPAEGPAEETGMPVDAEASECTDVPAPPAAEEGSEPSGTEPEPPADGQDTTHADPGT